MNRQQVLTGAANSSDHCYGIGSVEGIHFTAYAAGCNIVILASDFQRVQIIPGILYGNVQVSCIDCSTDSGKIAASFGNKVYIFEPSALLHQESSHKLDYEWCQTGVVETECNVHALSWNQDGSRLLTGGDVIQIWHLPEESHSAKEPVQFFIDGNGENNSVKLEEECSEQVPRWSCLWYCKPSNSVFHLKFSFDGLLFASAGKTDRLVKVWYENKKIHTPLVHTDSVSPKKEEVNYSFVYIAHPRAVTGFSWRKTSKYMPKGSVANMLITSCKDNICRIWCETILPEDGLVDLNQLDPHAAHNPGFHTQRHKKRFMQRLHHIRQVMHKRKKNSGPSGMNSTQLNIPNSCTVHDFHKFGVHPNSIAPGFHFHLAASINPETDIPLIPSIGPDSGDLSFVVHWLDNKELHFTLEAEKLLEDLSSGNQELPDELKPEAHSPTDVQFDGEEHIHGQNEPPEMSIYGRVPPRNYSESGIKLRRLSLQYMKKQYVSSESEVSPASSGSYSAAGVQQIKNTLLDPIDNKIEQLLRDWHHNPDMLFSIHPVDGSFLVWLVDWLDEYNPGLFRQAQISFSSRIPRALPIGDAMTMAPSLLLYCNYGKLDLISALREAENKNYENACYTNKYTADAMGKNSPGQSDNTMMPNVLMLSKHHNGSLNLWQISFAESSKFSTILSIAHASRVSGHRFHTNLATCHPVLPLLLTTSHHNTQEKEYDKQDCFVNNLDFDRKIGKISSNQQEECDATMMPNDVCSELILWHVGPVGPLSKSGGITELARINSPQISAFTNVAWLPTLLPSSTLGSFSNSPSALFIACEDSCLRIYQAVIDARTLIQDFRRHKNVQVNMSQKSSNSSSGWVQTTPTTVPIAADVLKIVSQQSTARPGCIIEREEVKDTKQEWGHIQLMHIFQEQLITGEKSGEYDTKGHTNIEALVDLQHVTTFEEHFFLVVIEKLEHGSSVLHMWRIVIASQGTEEPLFRYSPDIVYTQEEENTAFNSGHIKNEPMPDDHIQQQYKKLRVETTKLCSQTLDVPVDVSVLTASVSAGHLSSSSIYPACFAPYLISTGCSDGRVRFWKCKTENTDKASVEYSGIKYDWIQWDMMIQNEEETSEIKMPGKPIAVSCAYSGRVAVAYKQGSVKMKSSNPGNKCVNLCVSIYECESTGGSEWTLEDTIELKDINLPDPKANIDMNFILEDHPSNKMNCQTIISPTVTTPSIVKTVPDKSHVTTSTIKHPLHDCEESAVNFSRHLVQLDWVSMEDGSHILTVAVGSKVILFTAVSSEIASASKKDCKSTATRPSRGILQKSKSMTVQNFTEEIRWMRIRSIDLETADGLPPLPMHISWVRDGILVAGMENEMHIYSQWRGPGDTFEILENTDKSDARIFSENSLKGVLSSSNLQIGMGFKISPSVSSMKLPQSMSTASMSMLIDQTKRTTEKEKTKDSGPLISKEEMTKSDSINSLQLIQDCGLFEAARLVNPVLPQYHPKQLLELLNFGKIRRVKAILAHLVRCVSGKDNINVLYSDGSPQLRHRTLSVARQVASSNQMVTGDNTTLPEDVNLDYIEIASIPPLPLYALLAADEEPNYIGTCPEVVKSPTSTQQNHDYSTLFNTASMSDEMDDPFDENEVFSTNPKSDERRRTTSGQANPNYFGPSTALLLSKHLTHTHLPGLSSLDQMYLLALADTVANTKLDFTDQNNLNLSVIQDASKETSERDLASTENVDDCGLRYHLAARHYVYLKNTLPIRQRAQLQLTGLSPANFVWAYHSDSNEELLNVLPGMSKGIPTWTELKQFGVGWWLKNITDLRKLIEKVAKHAFQVNKDPLDAAIFYLAMKKKNVLWGLFRSVNDVRMEQFFKNNFKEERWRKAALKNAFALLGRQRFHHAAGFFLLAGAVRDAIEVCINKLDDVQLAMVIAKLYESELDSLMPENLKRIINEECIGCDQHGQNYDPVNAHPDPFIRSIAYWMLKDYSAALGTLLEVKCDFSGPKIAKSDLDLYSSKPSVFNFYNYLRTHPLLVRQQLAATAASTSQKVLLSGFVHGAQQSGEKNVTFVDKITPLERRLYFTTAHAHFKSGCPMLALEVLSKLPDVIDLENDITKSHSADKMPSSDINQTGILDSASPLKNELNRPSDNGNLAKHLIKTGEDLNRADQVEWNTTVSTSLDWSQPVLELISDNDDLELKWDDDADTDSVNSTNFDNEAGIMEKQSITTVDEDKITTSKSSKTEYKSNGTDIMAQQLKFIACMKILMEELSTLATGFEVDGGQLRFQLYIWLEKEVEVLRTLCSYGHDIDVAERNSNEGLNTDDKGDCIRSNLSINPGKPTLHEIILAEKFDFENKQARASRRKQWLKANQQLLRTLLSYSALHGSGGGGLASVRMELILLLQELQQEKIQQQLLSPLPFPTTLPLLSASVASSKTVIADPIRHLQSVIQDILHTVIEFRTPPSLSSPLSKAFTLRNISAALSACIYQALCDSDNFVVAISDHVDVGMEGFTSTNVVYKDSYLMAGAQRRRKNSSISEDIPNSLPAKWPGVSSLRALLAKECDEESPRINIQLCESLIAVYMSLLIHAMAVYDCNILYRLVAHTFRESMWPSLFGGGMKKLIRVTTTAEQPFSQPKDELTKQRIKLHMKVLAATGNTRKLKEDKPTYKEKFVPPEVSMISYFMTKPYENPDDPGIDYDSTESLSDSEEDEEDELIVTKKSDVGMTEHIDAHSYSWCLLRYSCVKYIRHMLLQFIPQIGIELPELPVCSPLVQAVLKALENWEELLKGKLDLFSGPPVDYIPGCFVDMNIEGPTIFKYKSLLEPGNTPFLSSHPSALPAKRLWHYLVKQEYLQEIFIRYIFKRKKLHTEEDKMKTESLDHLHPPVDEPTRIIHKEQDAITTFCINQANLHCISVSTQKEVVEMDITSLLNPPIWLEDETEYDVENINRPNGSSDAEDFLVVQTPQDRRMFGGATTMPPTAPGALPAPSSGHFAGHTGRGAGVVKGINIPGLTNPNFSFYIVDRSKRLMRRLAKRRLEDVRRMGAHPHLPYYLTGAQDGSVYLWEWGHNQHISVARQPGSFPKVTKVLFNAQGNKFGVSDGEGCLCLWQVGLGISMNKPYLNMKCHTKQANDFVFVGSSSLIATAGHSSENRNVCLWDTLLPQKNSLVQAFHCHSDGAPAILYAPQHQILISGGKRGEVSIFDVRQRQIRHSFQAHDSAVKTMTLDPLEQYFVTGSGDGDIKVWGLTVHNLVYAFPGEHSKGSLFRNVSAGVTQLYLSPEGHLFSCGADGSLRVRSLPSKHDIVQTYVSPVPTANSGRSFASLSGISEINSPVL